MNPYDPCVWNKMVKKTNNFYMDDNMITLYINKLHKEYAKMDALMVNR